MRFHVDSIKYLSETEDLSISMTKEWQISSIIFTVKSYYLVHIYIIHTYIQSLINAPYYLETNLNNNVIIPPFYISYFTFLPPPSLLSLSFALSPPLSLSLSLFMFLSLSDSLFFSLSFPLSLSFLCHSLSLAPLVFLVFHIYTMRFRNPPKTPLCFNTMAVK